MNDSLRTDVFVRYHPEVIGVACIYLSARKLEVPLPKKPSWFEVLGVEEDDIKDCCYRMIRLYNRQKVGVRKHFSFCFNRPYCLHLSSSQIKTSSRPTLTPSVTSWTRADARPGRDPSSWRPPLPPAWRR